MKDGAATATLPHQEWFCTKLGEAVGLASPSARVVEMNGVACFGSRWEGGVETGSDDSSFWWVRARSNQIDFSALSPSISRILAFDLFVHNVDRHLTNYLILKQYNGYAVRAFDYSRAWLFNGFPLPTLPMNPTTKTILAMRALRQLFGDFIEMDEVSYVCGKLKLVNTDHVNSFIQEHPSFWLTERQKSSILDWWSSSDRLSRIDKVEEGIKDGTCL